MDMDEKVRKVIAGSGVRPSERVGFSRAGIPAGAGGDTIHIRVHGGIL